MTLSYRIAMPGDEAVILPLTQKLATSFAVEPEFSKVFQHILSLPHMHLGVAVSSEKVVGYVSGCIHPALYASGSVAWIDEIVVEPEMRMKGVGRFLMHQFERWALSSNCRLVTLATRRASDFYTSLDYSESATYFKKAMQT